MGYFIFNNIRSDDMGLIVSGINTMNSAERSVAQIQIPGRNGDLIFDNGNFKNQRVSYPCAIKGNYATNAAAVRQWLCNLSGGYYELTDSYNPDEYRKARFISPALFSSWAAMRGADVNIEFDCKPQRFMISGKTQTVINSGQTASIVNPTENNAKPVIWVTCETSSGNYFTINGADVVVNTKNQTVIDSDNMLIYRKFNGENYSSIVVGDFPVLIPGTNTITTSGCKVYVFPNWYRL